MNYMQNRQIPDKQMKVKNLDSHETWAFFPYMNPQLIQIEKRYHNVFSHSLSGLLSIFNHFYDQKSFKFSIQAAFFAVFDCTFKYTKKLCCRILDQLYKSKIPRNCGFPLTNLQNGPVRDVVPAPTITELACFLINFIW